MTRVLAIGNLKGGVGKTTTTVNLGAALTERGRRVLVVDLDPQASLTLSLGFQLKELTRTVYQALTLEGMPLASVIVRTPDGIDLAPSRHELTQWADSATDRHNRVQAVREALAPIHDRYDYILLDCPANAGILTGSALVAADQVLIPLAADHLSVQALSWFLSIIERVQKTLNSSLQIAGIFFTMVDPRTRHARAVVESAQTSYGAEIPILDTAIRYCVSVRDASLNGESVLRYAPKSVAAANYRELAREVDEGPKITAKNELFFVLAQGVAYATKGDAAPAYAHYRRATELAPHLAGAWIGRGKSAPDWSERILCYGHALQATPDNEEMRRLLDECVSSGVSSADATGIYPLITSAHYLEEIGERPSAEALFKRITELDSQHIQGWLGRARTAQAPLEAVACAEKCLQINPGNELAQDQLEAARARAKDEAARRVEMGLDQIRQGKKERADLLFAEATALDPMNDRAWLGRAQSAGDFQSAFGLAKKALEVNPRNEQARSLYHMLYDPDDKARGPFWVVLRLLVPLAIIVVLIALGLFVIQQLHLI